MADWKKLLVENPPASDIASSPSSGKVLKVSSNGTGLEWADDAGGAFQITGSNAHYTAGSVGIGTSSPSQLLHIESSSFPTALIKGGSSGAILRLQGANNDYIAFHDNTSDKWLLRYQPGANKIDFLNNGLSSSALTILDSNNNIGIGTVSPSAKLHILAGNNNDAIRVTGADANYYGSLHYTNASTTTFNILNSYSANNASAIKLGFGSVSSNTNVMTLLKSGNIGIGTSSPSEKLHVNGNIKAGSTSRVFFNTNSTGIGSSTVNQLDVFSFGDMNISTENSSTSISFKPVGTTRFKLDTNSRISLSNNDAGDKNIIFGERAGNSIVSGGDQNNLFGYQTGYSITTGDYNVGIGNYNSYFNQTGSGNTAIGTQSMQGASGQSHSNNTSVGYKSLYSIRTASANVAIGKEALYSTTTGYSNTALGHQAMYYGTESDSNVAVGQSALEKNVTGDDNTAIGYQSQYGASGQSHSNNTSVGYQSLYSITTAEQVTAHGRRSAYNNTSGVRNIAIGSSSLFFNQTGNYNTAIGTSSMEGSSGNSHSNNTAIGYQSLKAISTGGNNTTLGYRTLATATTANYNVAIGKDAMELVSAGQAIANCVAVGIASLKGSSSTTTGINGTVAIGLSALTAITTGAGNTAVGFEAGKAILTGHSNTFLGYEAGSTFDGGESNMTAIGRNAMGSANNDSSSNCVAIGVNALEGGTGLITNNIAIGKDSMSSTSNRSVNASIAIGINAMDSTFGGTVTDCIAIGRDSMHHASNQLNGITGSIGIGAYSLHSLTTGSKNNSIGYKSGFSNTTGFNNQYFGYQSGYYGTTGRSNIAIGYNSQFGSSGLTTGTYNVSLGEQTLFSLTTGSHNFVVGSNAGLSLTSGEHNIICGALSGDALTTTSNTVIIGRASGSAINSTGANGSVLIGAYAGNALTSASNTVAIGMNAMIEHTTGNLNTVVGSNAMNDSNGHAGYANSFYGAFSGAGGWAGASHSNTAVGSHSFGGGAKTATAVYNTTVGRDSLYALTSGHNNSAYGYRSGNAITQGDANSTYGFQSGITIADGRRNTIIGSGSDVSASGALNQIVLGEGQTGVADNTAIIGNSAVTDVYMGDNGSAWSTTSDGRLKENIEEWSTGLDAINKLRVVEYNFKENNPHKYDHKKKRQGIIAQEAIEAIPEMIKDDGEWLSANQEPMIWALVNAVKELTKKVNELETKLNKEN